MDRTEGAVRERKKKRIDNYYWLSGGYTDYQLAFVTIAMVLFGLVMIFSASSYRAVLNGLESTYFVKRQAVFAVLGIFAMIVSSRFNYRALRKFARLAMAVSIALLVVVLIIGASSHGAVRWIEIAGIQFQPSEVAKVALVIYVAHMCTAKPSLLMDIKGLIKLYTIPLLCIILIGAENLSTAIVCFVIVFAIGFVASPRWQLFGVIAAVGVALMVIGIFAAGYRSDRIDTWLHPEQGDNFQTIQSLYAIGSGGLFGRGLGQSIQKMGFLPESHNDMIFSIICEELGLFGGIMVIVMFVYLIIRCRYIANHSRDRFGGLLVTGILVHIAFQAFVNIAVVTNTIPNTGVTLPFISYGGTSLVIMLVEMGIVLSVSRQNTLS